MLRIFKAKPVVSTQMGQQILTIFQEMFTQFGARVFTNNTQLVLPNDQFFPSQAGSLTQLAQQSFEQVKAHAQLSQWPIDFSLTRQPQLTTLPVLSFNEQMYGPDCHIATDYSALNRIKLSGNIEDFSNPQTAISHIIMQLSSIVLHYSVQEQAQDIIRIELLASFFGFGVMLANTTYQFRGGCGSCYNPRANRQHGLTEEEMVYALAIFVGLKEIRNQAVLPALKSYLRPVFKRARKQLETDSQYLALVSRLKG